MPSNSQKKAEQLELCVSLLEELMKQILLLSKNLRNLGLLENISIFPLKVRKVYQTLKIANRVFSKRNMEYYKFLILL